MPIPLLIQAESRAVPLADKSVHCIVTSPPYWGLRSYGIGTENGELGLESVHDCHGAFTGHNCGACYICHMREVARECWRVLRDDGVMFVNIGDSYAGSWGAQSRPNGTDLKSTLQGGSMLSARQIAAHPKGTHTGSLKHTPGLKNKDLCMIPARLALALQADGWTLRSEIIWHKPNPMPENVTDRPTRSHEQIFLFSKRERYFYDSEAIKEESIYPGDTRHLRTDTRKTTEPLCLDNGSRQRTGNPTGSLRTSRSVWSIATEPTANGHFATMPTALVRRCILAGTSVHGVCSACKAPWVRKVEQIGPSSWEARKAAGHVGNIGGSSALQVANGATHDFDNRAGGFGTPAQYHTTGWYATCACQAPRAHATVFDPFCGSGTTLAVACALGRDSLGTDLSYPYLHDIARLRLAESVAQPSLLYDAPRIPHNPRAEQIALL